MVREKRRLKNKTLEKNMIPQIQHIDIHSSGNFVTSAFKFDLANAGHLFAMISTDLYNDGPTTVVREYAWN